MKKTIISKIIIEVSLIDLFIFLDKRGYLKAFLNNTYAHLGKLIEVTDRPDSWMGQAFVWHTSPEGYETWAKLATDWRNYLLEGTSEEDIIEWRITSTK